MRPLCCLGERSGLGGPVDALFEARAADDLVAVPEANTDAGFAVLVPEASDPLVELLQLGGEDDVPSLGETVQESGAVLAHALDLVTDFRQCSHIWENDRVAVVIPGLTRSRARGSCPRPGRSNGPARGAP